MLNFEDISSRIQEAEREAESFAWDSAELKCAVSLLRRISFSFQFWNTISVESCTQEIRDQLNALDNFISTYEKENDSWLSDFFTIMHTLRQKFNEELTKVTIRPGMQEWQMNDDLFSPSNYDSKWKLLTRRPWFSEPLLVPEGIQWATNYCKIMEYLEKRLPYNERVEP